jgi:PIN domain nuclease of toxin-antitoxin system
VDRRVSPPIRLDTHVAVWLYTGEVERFSQAAIDAIEASSPVVSPMVQLELTYLHEIGRLTVDGAEIIGDLRDRVGLTISDVPLLAIVHAAASVSWTRDPFDRMIVADAIAASSVLLTKDATIAANFDRTIW